MTSVISKIYHRYRGEPKPKGAVYDISDAGTLRVFKNINWVETVPMGTPLTEVDETPFVAPVETGVVERLETSTASISAVDIQEEAGSPSEQDVSDSVADTASDNEESGDASGLGELFEEVSTGVDDESDGEKAGDDPKDEEPTVEALRAEYLRLYGKPAHGRTSVDTLKAKIAEKAGAVD